MRGRTRIELVLGIFLLVSFFAFGIATHAQEERITLTTYYPAPFGVYQTMRLFPSNVCTPFVACPRPGEMCYRAADNRMYICGGSPAQWRIVTNLWAISPTDSNSIYSLAPNNVGINTTQPMSTLDVRGSTNICVRLFFGPSTGMTMCPPGFGITTINPTIAAPQQGVIMCCRDCGAPDFNADGICP
jgi:hypothetical protein